jgi:hypothetical protein
MNEDTKIWFAYAIEDEGTENQRVRVFLSLSEEGLYEQAKYFKVRMRMPDYTTLRDMQEFDDEIHWDLEGDE